MKYKEVKVLPYIKVIEPKDIFANIVKQHIKPKKFKHEEV